MQMDYKSDTITFYLFRKQYYLLEKPETKKTVFDTLISN